MERVLERASKQKVEDLGKQPGILTQWVLWHSHSPLGQVDFQLLLWGNTEDAGQAEVASDSFSMFLEILICRSPHILYQDGAFWNSIPTFWIFNEKYCHFN